MMRKVVIATKNRGKAKEFEQLFMSLGVEVLTLLDLPESPDIEETGTTFEENAILKAEAIAAITGSIVIADDSGLMIDALDGRPGVFSARYAGDGHDDEANIDKVLDEMKHVPEEKRSARFYCALAIAGPRIDTITVSGSCEGMILSKRRGVNGFGYDPIFFVASEEKSMAELSPEVKNKLSHRAHALKKLESLAGKLFDLG